MKCETRKLGPAGQKIMERINQNPIVSHQILESEHITTQEDIRELQRILVQTCIDFINKKGLTDIFSVSFHADALSESAKYGSWQPCTDSSILIKGLNPVIYTRKDGSVFTDGATYDIGESL